MLSKMTNYDIDVMAKAAMEYGETYLFFQIINENKLEIWIREQDRSFSRPYLYNPGTKSLRRSSGITIGSCIDMTKSNDKLSPE